MIRTREGYSRRPIGAVRRIRGAIDRGRKDPHVRRLATWILNREGVPARDERGEVEAIFDFATSIPFRRDPVGVELLQHTPYQLENLRIGAEGLDCDDFTIFLASLLESIGHPVRIAVTRLPGAADDGHIYVETFLRTEGEWIPLDATNERAAVGWEPPFAEKKTMRATELGFNFSGPFDRLAERAEEAIRKTRGELERIGILDARVEPMTTTPAAPAVPSKAPPWAFLAIAAGVAFLAVRRGR